MADDMKAVIAKQKAALTELSAQIKSLEKSDLFVAHEEHRNAYEKLNSRYEKAELERQQLVTENAELKTKLYEQYFSEKAYLLANRQEKIGVYFQDEIKAEENRLLSLEREIHERIKKIKFELEQNHVALSDELHVKLAALKKESQEKITQARENLSKHATFTKTEQDAFVALEEEPLSEEQILAQTKKNNIERLIGLNVLNIIGVLLLIIGVIAAGQFAYARMGDAWRAALLFSLGAILLVAGEILNRRRANAFSFGITAGGVGILYAALAVSYFVLGVLSLYIALAVCIAITALSFFLSMRYHAQTLLAIALVGGYLPILAIEITRPVLFSAMGYFVILNLLALSIAFRRKWTVASFVGLGLNLIGTAGLSFLIFDIHPFHERAIEIVYILFAMFIYLAIPLIATYATKTRFRAADIVLLGINTVFGSLILFFNISSSGWGDALGLTSLLFALLYLAIGYTVRRKFQAETVMAALFFITGLTFAVLVVPFQFDAIWFTFAWLVQGTSLVLYGTIKERKNFQRAGFVVAGLSLLWFLSFDFSAWRLSQELNPHFSWQYLAVTTASVLIVAAFAYKNVLYRQGQRVFLYVTASNLWLYILFLISRLHQMLLVPMQNTNFDRFYLMLSLACVATLLLGMVYRKIPRIQNSGMTVISIVLYSLCSMGIFLLNIVHTPVIGTMSAQSAGTVFLATIILLVLGAVGAFAMYMLCRFAVAARVFDVQHLPLILSAYILLLITIKLIHAYGLSFASFWISIVYVLAALLWTILGFMKRYTLLRRFGLGLALFTVSKLFLLDLHALTEGFRILSYFILGFILIGISFVYQYFNKRLESETPSQGKLS